MHLPTSGLDSKHVTLTGTYKAVVKYEDKNLTLKHQYQVFNMQGFLRWCKARGQFAAPYLMHVALNSVLQIFGRLNPHLSNQYTLFKAFLIHK